MKYSIRYKLILGIVLPLFVVYCLFTAAVLWFDLSAAFKYTRQTVIKTAVLEAMTFEKVFSNVTDHAKGLARYVAIHRPDSLESITLHIQDMLMDYPYAAGSAVAFEPGIFPGQSGLFAPYVYRNENVPQDIKYKDIAAHDYLTEEWYAKAKQTGLPCWSEPYFDANGAEIVMCTYSVPVFVENQFVGVVTIDISLDTIRKEICGIVAEDKGGIVFSASGTIITASNREWDMTETIYTIADKYKVDAFRQAGEEVDDIQLNYYRFKNPSDSEHSVLVCVPLKETGWGLMVWQSEGAVRQPIYQRASLRSATFLLMLMFIVGLIAAMTRQITQPMGKLVQFAQELADGNLDAKISGIKTNDEIEQLAKVFNQMEASLKKSIEETIQSRVEAAEASNRVKTKFLTLASHELRTPVHGILSAVELLLKTPLNERQIEYVDIQRESSFLLLLLISNILDYSKLDVEGITLHKTVFSIRELIEQIRPILLFQAKNQNVNVNIQFDDRIKDPVGGDATRLRQVMLNLLTNAVKFSSRKTYKGNVTLNIKLSSNDADTQRVRFEVIDDGIGITEERQKMLCGTWQDNTADNRLYDGFGLGLVVSQAIIDKLNGSKGIRSKVQNGSTFWFDIPLPREVSENPSTVSFIVNGERIPKILKVLIAEDNKINQLVITQMLKNLGYETTVAENGRKAVDAWESGDFDVVLMDCQMPEMDGYEATQMIREKEQKSSKMPIPIFAVTANTSPGDKERCFAAGMNDYFNKPVTADELAAAIECWITKIRSQ